MRYAIAPVAFGIGANALVARQSTQCYQLQASGGASGVLGQLGDGQNRIGDGSLPTGCYCLSGDGTFTDSNGRGCILTPPTTQFQCDAGASPTPGFGIGPDGGVTYNGSGHFYACPVNDAGVYNIYSQPVEGQDKCVEISLSTAGACGAGNGGGQPATTKTQTQPVDTTVVVGTQTETVVNTETKSAPTQPGQTGKPGGYPGESGKPGGYPGESGKPGGYPGQSGKPGGYPGQTGKPGGYPVETPASECVPNVVTVTQTLPAPTKPAPTYPADDGKDNGGDDGKGDGHSGVCPADLNGNYEYPHLIVPVDSKNPHKAYGTSYNGKIDSHTCSIFNFDIPASMAGKKCSTIFLFPKKSELETSDYTMSGHGEVTVSKMSSPATEGTTYENKPHNEGDVGHMTLSPGNSYTADTGDCAAGQRISYMMCGSGDLSLDYFQDYNPKPIGLYVRSC